jgi:hypothetical protein
VSVPLAVAWAALGVWLGRQQERQAERRPAPPRGREQVAPHERAGDGAAGILALDTPTEAERERRKRLV